MHFSNNRSITWNTRELISFCCLKSLTLQLSRLIARNWRPSCVVRATSISFIQILIGSCIALVYCIFSMIKSTHWLIIRALRSSKSPSLLLEGIFIVIILTHLFWHFEISFLTKHSCREHLVSKFCCLEFFTFLINNNVPHGLS